MGDNEDATAFGLALLQHAAPTFAIGVDGAIVPGAPPVAPAPPPPPPAPAKQPLLSREMLQRAIGAPEAAPEAASDDGGFSTESMRQQLDLMMSRAAKLVRDAGEARRVAQQAAKSSGSGKKNKKGRR